MLFEDFHSLTGPWQDPCLLVNAQGVLETMNPAGIRLFGLEPESIHQRNLTALVLDPPDRVARYLTTCLRSRQPMPGALTVRNAGGTPTECRVSGYRLTSGVSAPSPLVFLHCTPKIQAANRFIALNRALEELRISHHKLEQQSRRLAAAHQQFATVLDSIDASIYVSDLHTYEVLFANQYCQRLFGDIVGKSCWQVIQKDQSGPCAFCRNGNLLDSRGMPAGPCTWENRNTVTNRWFAIRDRAIPWMDGRLVKIQIATDITEQKKREGENLRAQKLQATAVLAGGIAHDFNNLLTVICGNIELALHEIQEGRSADKFLEKALNAAFQGKNLTNKFITFTQSGNPVRKPISLRDVILDTAQLFLSGTNIESVCSLPEDLWAIDADREQIAQAFQNIIVNAKEAMPRGGRLEIRADNLREGKKRLTRISFADTGAGIPEEHLASIFDPYFSTKDRGAEKGMGLGLTVVDSIIKQHGGTVRVTSRPGEGAAFEILLPASESSAAAHPAPAKSAPAKRRPRILVMDDDPHLREIVIIALQELGYTATEASHGEETLRLFEEARAQGQPFAAVLLDLTIKGGMGGLDTFAELLKVDRDVKGIVISGYADHPAMAEYADYGFKAAITKPFRIAALAQTVQNVLSS